VTGVGASSRTASTRTGARLTVIDGDGPISAARLAVYASGALVGLAIWLGAGLIGIAVLLLGML
jgi:hypothetical protein